LTDFGLSDHYVGVMKGVLLTHCPEVRLIDITHQIQPQSVLQGAFCLSQAVPHFPPSTIFLAVVDPGVGTLRKAIAAEAGGYRFVLPDNGLLGMVSERLGGELRAVSLAVPESASGTFHGRDVFAPAAGRLAAGCALEDLGERVEELIRLERRQPHLNDTRWSVSVLFADHFGNICLDLEKSLGESFFQLDAKYKVGESVVTFGHTFGQVARGESLLLWNSSNYLELAVREGSAEKLWGLSSGSRIVIEKV
ncbi:MAG TPA: hypothetical protein EYO33_27775, partial [Phycisphaerales bacterium]|nr:hypothetical protein [Phycisphaerales bacterium]